MLGAKTPADDPKRAVSGDRVCRGPSWQLARSFARFANPRDRLRTLACTQRSVLTLDLTLSRRFARIAYRLHVHHPRERMTPLVLSCVIFLLVLGGILAGVSLRRLLPDHHLSKETQDVVRLGAGLIATIAALVLGLLIGGAKGSFDTRNTQVKQLTANIILLDNLLSQYGPEAAPLRRQVRSAINPLIERLWHEKITSEPFTVNSEGEKTYLAILALSPKTEIHARSRLGRHRLPMMLPRPFPAV